MRLTRDRQLLRQPAKLRSAIEAVIAKRMYRDLIEAVATRFHHPTRVMIEGGVLRNAALAFSLQRDIPNNDIDFVVFGLSSDDELAHHFRDVPYVLTTFGGLKLQLGRRHVDIWRAELQMKVAGVRSRIGSIDDFLQAITLTTDAVVYEIQTGELHECGFYRAINLREIDIGARSRWSPRWAPYHLAHLAYVHHLTGFQVSSPGLARVRSIASPSAIKCATHYLATRKSIASAHRIVDALVRQSQPLGGNDGNEV